MRQNDKNMHYFWKFQLVENHPILQLFQKLAKFGPNFTSLKANLKTWKKVISNFLTFWHSTPKYYFFLPLWFEFPHYLIFDYFFLPLWCSNVWIVIRMTSRRFIFRYRSAFVFYEGWALKTQFKEKHTQSFFPLSLIFQSWKLRYNFSKTYKFKIPLVKTSLENVIIILKHY